MGAPLKLLRVIVSYERMVYLCLVETEWIRGVPETRYLCGKCGDGKLGPRPAPGEYCPKCGARVEEAI